MRAVTTNQSGFTLIELSIVLVIIGLIVGGVLVGRDLIQAAEMRKLIGDVQRIGTAVHTFRTKYNALPGDMDNATGFWGTDAGCPSTASNNVAKQATCNGNGDRKIGNMNAAFSSTVGAMRYEYYRAWQQLANASLIEGSYTGTSGPIGTHDCGTAFLHCPGSNIAKAMYRIMYWGVATAGGDFFAMPPGHWIQFGTPHPASGQPYAPAIRTTQALSVDQKMDDGLPGSGRIYSFMATTTIAPGCTSDPGGGAAQIYDVTSGGILCSLWFNVF